MGRAVTPLLVALAGCGQAAVTAPKPVPPKPEPAPTRPPAVFFLIEAGFDEPVEGRKIETYQAALPSACWDGSQFHGEEDECRGLLPAAPQLALSDGSKVVAKGDGLAQCEVAGFSTRGLRMPGENLSGMAVWSPDGSMKIELATDGKAATPAELAAVTAMAGGGPLEVTDVSVIDVDGDDRPDRFVAAHVAAAEGDPFASHKFSRLVLFRGAAPTAAVQLAWEGFDDTAETFSVSGAVDLDGDGQVEIVVSGSSGVGSGTVLVEFDEDSMTTIGGWGCSD